VQKNTSARLAMPVREIGGVKAYVEFSVYDDCRVYVPISFELGLEFTTARNGGDCAPEEFVADAVAAVRPGRVSRWDACGALGTALGKPGELIPAGAYVGVACERTEPSPAHLDFRYSNPVVGDARTETLDGVRVTVQEDGSACWVAWRAGAADTTYARSPDEWARVAAADCGAARDLAGSVMTVLATPPPRDTPQAPLFYGMDEPDSPFTGACAHLGEKGCAPYREVAVPHGTAAVLKTTDVDVQCALAQDAVAGAFGDQLVPVTANDSCYFVGPERQVQVRVRVRSSPVTEAAALSEVRRAEIAGHPGYVADTPGSRGYEAWVALSDDPAEDGHVSVAVDRGPASHEAGAPAEAAAKVDQMITAILAEYFS
jgi:hypothetical protein